MRACGCAGVIADQYRRPGSDPLVVRRQKPALFAVGEQCVYAEVRVPNLDIDPITTALVAVRIVNEVADLAVVRSQDLGASPDREVDTVMNPADALIIEAPGDERLAPERLE
jgi:hypothetical protein